MTIFTTKMSVPDRDRSKHIKVYTVSQGALEDSSDNSKELKRKPNKHKINLHTNLYSLIDNKERFKQKRSSPAFMDDSTGAVLH
ncbi:unnamed protein product [Rhizophagus irregularis]|nr:unnamed protein product [Rhizophagus irregularis]